METVIIYHIGQSTDFFTNLETLWKSFVFSYHRVPGECKRESLYVFVDPNGNKYEVNFAQLHREVTHL